MRWSRRDILFGGAGLAAPGSRAWGASVSGSVDRPRPRGVMAGDVDPTGAVIWARSDRSSRLRVFWDAGTAKGEGRGPLATSKTDFTAQVVLRDLPPDQTVRYAARFEDRDTGKLSDALEGSFRTAPASRRDVRFHWGGDLAGQGWGIDPNRGGYPIFTAMADRDPDFLVFCGDRIYADQPIRSSMVLPDGTTWNNLVTPETSRVAQTLEDFRGRYSYHLLDSAYRSFHQRVPVVCTWDDHEVIDNWARGGVVSDKRYAETSMSRLARHARQAMGEYTPMRRQGLGGARMYRKVAYGPLLDVFVLDGRSYRSVNGPNVEPSGAKLLGPAQIGWLKRGLANSTARWKVVVQGQPIAVRIWDDWARKAGHDGVANTHGAPLGREQEIADILAFIHQADVDNVVWLSADVHYAAAHEFQPGRAATKNFRSFWEFVAGPFHAGTFGPGEIDTTFGPAVRFQRGAPAGRMGAGPAEKHQFFGEVDVSGATGALTVRLIDIDGVVVHTQILPGARS